jgi:hypothetical protein
MMDSLRRWLFVRTSIASDGFVQMQRVLAQGEPSDAALRAMQRLLEDDDAEPLLLEVARTERAFAAIPPEQFGQTRPRPSARRFGPAFVRRIQDRLKPYMSPLLADNFEYQRIASFRHWTQVVEMAKQHRIDEQESQLFEMIAKLEAKINASGTTNRADFALVLREEKDLYQELAAHRAKTRTALVTIAAERYRRAYGKWPGSIDALIHNYLAKTPMDPFDGAPIRMQPAGKDLVIYSVGVDRTDDGGNLGLHSTGRRDIGFWLWDVGRRRQPARKAP